MKSFWKIVKRSPHYRSQHSSIKTNARNISDVRNLGYNHDKYFIIKYINIVIMPLEVVLLWGLNCATGGFNIPSRPICEFKSSMSTLVSWSGHLSYDWDHRWVWCGIICCMSVMSALRSVRSSTSWAEAYIPL